MSIMDRIFGSSQPTQTAPSPTGDIKNAGNSQSRAAIARNYTNTNN